jgi:hypothetical protein
MSLLRPDVIPGYRDKHKYWHDARSACCQAHVVYFRSDARTYVHWHGYEESVPDELRCEKCDLFLTISKRSTDPCPTSSTVSARP